MIHKALKQVLLLSFLILFPIYGSDLKPIKNLAVQHQGRIKPFDTVARNSLLIFRGNQNLSHNGKKYTPSEWLGIVTMAPQEAMHFKVFRIDHPDLKTLIKSDAKEEKYFSLDDLKPHFEMLSEHNKQAFEIDESARDSYQKAVSHLWERIILYNGLSHSLFFPSSQDPIEEFHSFKSELAKFSDNRIDKNEEWLLFQDKYRKRYQFLDHTAEFQILYTANKQDEAWKSVGKGLIDHLNENAMHPGIEPILTMISVYRESKSEIFARLLEENIANTNKGNELKIGLEVLFNTLQPFYLSIILYILCFIGFMTSLLTWQRPLRILSYSFLSLAFTLHTSGLLCRMFIESRPPITNLYSSAIFVGWSSVLLGIIIERIHRNGIGASIASLVGSTTLIIAHHLAETGDTMEMMRAVLNSNFWLSTHVVTISLGYSSAFLAGTIACAYVLRQLFTPPLSHSQQLSFARIVYGTICFSTFFSFVGTVLGGIWADQSWGRFWGWDPKENGALMIVLWNAIILHARWGGIVKTQGLMLLAIVGNIITSFSWFGVNMLGVGLHSYGFIDKAFTWLLSYIFLQLFIISLGCIPVDNLEDQSSNKQ
jgi:ABC-type transport system involved in cytochrome c biogenesis permease subunit